MITPRTPLRSATRLHSVFPCIHGESPCIHGYTGLHGCTRLYTAIPVYTREYTVFYSAVQRCYTGITVYTRLHGEYRCTRLYSGIYGCTAVFPCIHRCTAVFFEGYRCGSCSGQVGQMANLGDPQIGPVTTKVPCSSGKTTQNPYRVLPGFQ